MTTDPEGAELAAQRLKLFDDAVALRKPDRVPLMPLALEYFHTRMAGVSDRDAGYDAKLNFDCLRDATVRFGWDWAPGHGRAPVEVARGARVEADPLARRRPAGRRPVPVGRGRVPQGRRVRRVPRGPDQVHPAHPVAAPRKRLRRARRAPPAAGLVDQHHVLPAGLGGAAGRAADDGHVRGARGDEPGRRRVHGGVRGLHGPDGRDGLSGRLRRGHEDALRHRLRRLPRPARQHHRPLPSAGQAPGAHGDADAHGHRPGHRRRQGQREPARVHPAAPRRGRLPQRRAVREVLLAGAQGRSSSRCSMQASPRVPSSRATTRRASSTWRSCRPAWWPRTSTAPTARSSRRSAGTTSATGATCRGRSWSPAPPARSRTTSRS